LDQRAAPVIIDLQKSIVSYPAAYPIDDVVKRILDLLKNRFE
jgi:hypothetical protein